MNSRSKRQQKRNVRAKDGAEIIARLLNNKHFIKNYGKYIRVGEGIVYPKHQDIVYLKRDTIEIEKLILEQVKYVTKKINTGALPGGDSLYFLVPLSAIIALPQGYKANRAISKNETSTQFQKILSVTLINGAELEKESTGNEPPVFSGISFALIGIQLDTEINEEQYINYYLECVAYLNDFITAWKLFRHDHTIKNVTPRTLPECVDYYYIKRNTDKLKKGLMRVHGNDLADLWSKRLPESLETLETEMFRLCEYLPANSLAHYTLRIGERATTDFCLGQYEDSIINSDRYAELALRDILRHELNLNDEELGKYKTLYSANSNVKAVVQTLAKKLDCSGDAIISKWYTKARNIRNNITHRLDVAFITPDIAKDALQYNFKLVDLMAKKATNDFEWYSMMNKNFYSLFEEPIK